MGKASGNHLPKSMQCSVSFATSCLHSRAIPGTDVTNVTKRYTCYRAPVFELKYLLSFLAIALVLVCQYIVILSEKIMILFIVIILWSIQEEKVIKFSQFQRNWLFLRKLTTIIDNSIKTIIKFTNILHDELRT